MQARVNGQGQRIWGGILCLGLGIFAGCAGAPKPKPAQLSGCCERFAFEGRCTRNVIFPETVQCVPPEPAFVACTADAALCQAKEPVGEDPCRGPQAKLGIGARCKVVLQKSPWLPNGRCAGDVCVASPPGPAPKTFK